MKRFVELIRNVSKEQYTYVVENLMAKRIPVAFLSLVPINDAIQKVSQIRARGLNVTTLIVTDTTPPPDVERDFKIIHLDKILKLQPRPEYILVLESIYDNATARLALKYLPNCKVINLNEHDTESFFLAFFEYLPELYEVYDSLIDEKSKETFCGYWLGRSSNQFGRFVYADNEQYLTAGFIPNQGGVVIEAGAYDGATAAIFSDFGYKVYTFEMDKISFDKAKKLAAEKNFVIENMGLGSYNHEMRYKSNGGEDNRWDNAGNDVAKVVGIDSYVREKKIPRVDLIKLDVEGAELDVLEGAKATIALYKPILALSAYHKLDDFVTLTNFVKSIRPDYEFALRHYPVSSESLFDKNKYDRFFSMGLQPDSRTYGDCVLLAR